MRPTGFTLVLCLGFACAAGPQSIPNVAEPKPRAWKPQLISREAAAIFSLVDRSGPGASLVVDAESMRELGFLSPDADPKQIPGTDFLLSVLPLLAAELGEQGAALARLEVLLGIQREWGGFPRTQRFGVILRGALSSMDTRQLLESALFVTAVDGDEAAVAEYIRGDAALLQAGFGAKKTVRGKLLCLQWPDLPTPLCRLAGPGYHAAGTEATLNALGAAVASAHPVSPAAMLRFRLELPRLGKGELSIAGHAGLELRAALETDNPLVAERIERELREGLLKLDKGEDRARDLVGRALEEMQRGLARDGDAPAKVKASAAGLTPERLMDRSGNFAAVRRSIRISRVGGALTAAMSFPEKLVQDQMRAEGMLTGFATLGVLSAIAIPNLIKFQCLSRQAEAKAGLKAFYAAQRAHKQETGQFAALDQLGIAPQKGNRYSYCTREQCLPCTSQGCHPPDPRSNACTPYLETRDDGFPTICAVSVEGTTDIWTVDGRGVPENPSGGCR